MHDQLFLVGGSHSAVKEAYKTSNWEVRKGTSYYQGHHPIAQEHIEATLGVLGLEAPSICISFSDHKNTASWGNKTNAQDYRLTQSSFLWEGRLSEAWAMDVADFLKFKDEQGQSKYAEAITKAEAHLLKLDEERKLKHQLDEKFKVEITERQRNQKEIETKRTLAEQSEKLKQLEKAEALKQEVAKLEAERKASLEQTLERTKQARIERAQEVLQQKQQFLEREKFLLQEAKIEQLQKELIQTKAELAQQRSENHTVQHGQQVSQEAQLLQKLWNMQAPLTRQDYEGTVKGLVASAVKITLEVFNPTAQDSNARITVDNYQGFRKDLVVRAPEEGWKDAHRDDKNFLRGMFLAVLLTDGAYERYCNRWEDKLVVQQQELRYQEQRQRSHRHGLGY